MNAATFHFHIDTGLTLKIGANGHTVALYPDSQTLFPIGYVYLDEKYSGAVQGAVDAFNRAFSEAMSAGDNARTWTEAAE